MCSRLRGEVSRRGTRANRTARIAFAAASLAWALCGMPAAAGSAPLSAYMPGLESYGEPASEPQEISAWRIGDTLFVHQARKPVEAAKEVAPPKPPKRFDARQLAAELVRGFRYAMLPPPLREGVTAAEMIEHEKPGGFLGTARRPKTPVDVLRRMPPLSMVWMLGSGILLLGISGVCGMLSRAITPYSRPDLPAPPAPPLLRFARKEW